MTEAEQYHIIRNLDQALNAFRQNEGRLAAAEIRARTMLAIVRSEIAQGLADSCHGSKLGTERFDVRTDQDGHTEQIA